jgi:hypothetical protein
MWLFLILIFFLSYMYLAISISLFERKRATLFYSLIIGFMGFVLFPYATQVSLSNVRMALNDHNFVSLICVLQIIESAIFLILSLLLIRAHYKGSSRVAERMIPYIPSGIFFAGMFMFETYLFNMVSGMSFGTISLLFSASIFVLLFTSALIIRKLIHSWEIRMEIRVILSFFQIMLGMFLPLILMGLKVRGTQLQVQVIESVLTWIGLSIIIIYGIMRKSKKTRKGIL